MTTSEPCGCCQDAARFIGSGEPNCPSCGHAVDDCAAPETGYLEDCCFNYPRDHCKGRGCLCGCHERKAIPTCGHRYPSWRVTNGPRHVLLCWECIQDEIQESKIDQPILIVRETD